MRKQPISAGELMNAFGDDLSLPVYVRVMKDDVDHVCNIDHVMDEGDCLIIMLADQPNG